MQKPTEFPSPSPSPLRKSMESERTEDKRVISDCFKRLKEWAAESNAAKSALKTGEQL